MLMLGVAAGVVLVLEVVVISWCCVKESKSAPKKRGETGGSKSDELDEKSSKSDTKNLSDDHESVLERADSLLVFLRRSASDTDNDTLARLLKALEQGIDGLCGYIKVGRGDFDVLRKYLNDYEDGIRSMVSGFLGYSKWGADKDKAAAGVVKALSELMKDIEGRLNAIENATVNSISVSTSALHRIIAMNHGRSVDADLSGGTSDENYRSYLLDEESLKEERVLAR